MPFSDSWEITACCARTPDEDVTTDVTHRAQTKESMRHNAPTYAQHTCRARTQHARTHHTSIARTDMRHTHIRTTPLSRTHTIPTHLREPTHWPLHTHPLRPSRMPTAHPLPHTRTLTRRMHCAHAPRYAGSAGTGSVPSPTAFAPRAESLPRTGPRISDPSPGRRC